ncbi:unnamed protein product [Lota lota]
MPENCFTQWMVLIAMSLGLLLSIGINVACCFLRQREDSQRDSNEKRYQRQSSSIENGADHFQDVAYELQENPIYGNILKERRAKEFTAPRETMTMQHRREGNKPSESHMNYASLDLNVIKRGKKTPGAQPEPTADPRLDLLACLPRPSGADLQPPEAEEGLLPSGVGGSTVASHSSIYLNSQQIAMETEEQGRDETSQPPVWCSDRDWPVQNGGWEPVGEGNSEDGSVGSEGEGWLEARC